MLGLVQSQLDFPSQCPSHTPVQLYNTMVFVTDWLDWCAEEDVEV